MSSIVNAQPRPLRRSVWIWFAPVQAAVAFTVLAIAAGGQVLRTWALTALVWLMAMPLFVSLEAGLVAMILFEPFRGVLRRAQYLFVDYTSEDPIHLLTRHLEGGLRGGFTFGACHGGYCAGCCWGLMLMLLAFGVMNLAAMIMIAALIAAEKLLAKGEAIARIVGSIAIIAGLYLAARALP